MVNTERKLEKEAVYLEIKKRIRNKIGLLKYFR